MHIYDLRAAHDEQSHSNCVYSINDVILCIISYDEMPNDHSTEAQQFYQKKSYQAKYHVGSSFKGPTHCLRTDAVRFQVHMPYLLYSAQKKPC